MDPAATDTVPFDVMAMPGVGEPIMIPSDDESEVDVPDTLVVASPEAASDRPTDADIADSLAKAADGIEVPEGALQESDLQELPQPGPSQECSNLNELPQPGFFEECSNPKELPQPGPSRSAATRRSFHNLVLLRSVA